MSALHKTMPAENTAIEIVAYQPQYHADVVTLVTSIQQQELRVNVTYDEQFDLKDITGVYMRNNGNFWLAMAGDTLVGTIGLIDIGNNTGALKKMFVHAEYRRSTIGKKLLDTLLQWARNHGMRHLYLGTAETLTAAHRFYEKNSFQAVEGGKVPQKVEATLVKADTRRYYRNI